MQATLMNFGDNTRVVYDMQNKPCVIDIGQVVEADIAEVHFHMIKRALATDTLMVVPKDTRMSSKLQAILDILKSIETDPYATVLEKFNAVAEEMREEHEDIPVQPARNVIRRLLRDLAKFEVAKAVGMSSKVIIREEGDEVTRQPVPPPTPAPDNAPTPISEPGAEPQVEKVPPQPPPKVKKARTKKEESEPAPRSRKRERL